MDNKEKTKIFIGFIAYGESTAKYLPYFLASLKEQTFKDFRISLFDNSAEEENENKKFIKEKYPEIAYEWAGKNLGFAKAFNILIKKASVMGAEYFLAINPDIVLDDNVLGLMVKEMDNNKELGSASPKTLKWNFRENKKTNIIDTCGIQLSDGLKFSNIGEGEADNNQYNHIEILGPSGSAGFYRISALEKVKKENEYFDELMFMYKEDCDLAYRLFLAGYKSKLVSEARAYHDRTVAGIGRSNLEIALNRKNKDRQQKKWSFLNQQIIFLKYWHLQSWRSRAAIVWFELKMLLFSLLFEPYLLSQFKELRRIRKKIEIYK